MNQSRHPAGAPNGGRFAAQPHAEADILLDDPAQYGSRAVIDAHLEATGQRDLAAWAAESDYRQDGDVWVDDYGNEVDIEVAFTNAMEANLAALDAERDDYDRNAGWEGAWETECPNDAMDRFRISGLLQDLGYGD